MISSLVLTGLHEIGIDKNEKYMLDGTKTHIKDVPFMRYRLSKYSEEEIEYIKKMKKKFHYSTHMVEVILSEDIIGQLKLIENTLDDVAVYIYVPIGNDEAENGIKDDVIELLKSIKSENFDRIMMKDNSQTLHLVSANKIKKQIATATGFSQADVGICSSPLSFDGEACLTALHARNLTAMYSNNEDCAIPSSNHECMNHCGCIRYKVVNCDIAAPVASATSKKNSNSGKKSESTVKTKKMSKLPKEW